MADTIMSEDKPSRAPSCGDIHFDGNILDLDRVLAFVHIQHMLYPSAFQAGSTKVAYLLGHFRGPALDWAGRQIVDTRPAAVARLSNYEQMCNHVRFTFGYEAAQVVAISQTRLDKIHQTGDLLEFLTEFEGLCSTIGLHSDATRITILLPKLQKEYRESLISGGDLLDTYSSLRHRLINIYSRSGLQKKGAESQRAASRCNKCGKRGHTASQCVAKN
jgi:hypothetical protein